MEDRGIAVRLPARARGLPLHHRVQTGPGLRIRWVGWGFTPEGRVARNETDNSYLVSSLKMHVFISSHSDRPPRRGAHLSTVKYLFFNFLFTVHPVI